MKRRRIIPILPFFRFPRFLLLSLLINSIYLCGLLAFLGLHVGVNEELSKENEKRHDVGNVGANNPQRSLFTSSSEEVGSLGHHGDELDHLHHSEG